MQVFKKERTFVYTFCFYYYILLQKRGLHAAFFHFFHLFFQLNTTICMYDVTSFTFRVNLKLIISPYTFY